MKAIVRKASDLCEKFEFEIGRISDLLKIINLCPDTGPFGKSVIVSKCGKDLEIIIYDNWLD